MRSDGAALAGTGQLTAGREELGACGMCGLLTAREGVCPTADECGAHRGAAGGSGYVDGTGGVAPAPLWDRNGRNEAGGHLQRTARRGTIKTSADLPEKAVVGNLTPPTAKFSRWR